MGRPVRPARVGHHARAGRARSLRAARSWTSSPQHTSGMFDRVRELIEGDPSLVFARGGDGKTALHCARTVEIARYLLDRGADIDARDVDHESTRSAVPRPRRARGGTTAGRSRGVVRHLHRRRSARPSSRRAVPRVTIRKRSIIGRGRASTSTVHKGRPSTREEIGDHRGDTYRWVFGHNVSALDAARILGFDDIVAAPAAPCVASAAAARRLRRRRSCRGGSRRRRAPRRRRHLHAGSDAADRGQGARERHRGRDPHAGPRLRRARARPGPFRGRSGGPCSWATPR